MSIEKLGKKEVPCGAFITFQGDKQYSFRCSKRAGHASKHKTLAPVSFTLNLQAGLKVVVEHGVEWELAA